MPKCLITGLPERSLKASYERIVTVIDKNGPFDGGWFWCWSKGSMRALEEVEFLKELVMTKGMIKEGTRLYLVGGEGDVLNLKGLLPDLRAGLMSMVLEPAGSLKLENGFTIAYVNGASPGPADISLIREKRVEFLFTFAWPEGMKEDVKGSAALAALYRDHGMRPRYHFATQEGIFYERRVFKSSEVTTLPDLWVWEMQARLGRGGIMHWISIPESLVQNRMPIPIHLRGLWRRGSMYTQISSIK